jgi:dihydropteroate synthase
MNRLISQGLGRRTLIMGVLNVTPDSFSDGGLYTSEETASARARKMIAQGADIIDIGGESTRPATFSDQTPLGAEEEIKRILPVIRRLAKDSPNTPISVDTYKAEVATAAIEAGAHIINDISGLTYDPEMAVLAARAGVPVVIMHLLGEPKNIPLNPTYNDVVGEIGAFFEKQIAYAKGQGIAEEQIILDPGIGFGKSAEHNLEVIRRLAEFKKFGRPILVGPSRKRFLGKLLDGAPPEDRLEGTAAAVAISIANGADIVRVHDVRQIARVAKVADAIVRFTSPSRRVECRRFRA